MKPTPMCLSRRDASPIMQYDLLGSPLDLDLRSNFQVDLRRSTCIPLDAPCQDKHNDAKLFPFPLLVKKL